MTGARLAAWGIDGIPEVVPGDDLAALIGDALDRSAADDPGARIADGDILSVTSKVVSKAEGRIVAAQDREAAITAETVRIVASRAHPGGATRIVENRLGIVAAAAGVDASNTAAGTVLLLPADPDESARRIRAALQNRFGVRLGVIVTDTLGRPWRTGQTDVAIGAAGVVVVSELRGVRDSAGRELVVTAPAIGDEVAALTDLVKGKTSGCPAAVVRGLARHVTDDDGSGARALLRDPATDMFRRGSDEAYADGFAAGVASAADTSGARSASPSGIAAAAATRPPAAPGMS